MKISPTIILITFFAVTLFWLIINSRLWLNNSLFGILIVVFSVILSLQAVLTLFWMLYTWEDPEKARSYRSPRNLSVPAYSFTAFLPARHEEKVISDTIQAVNKIDYPNDLKEIIIICRNDDEETIKKAQTTIEKLKNPNIHLIIFDDLPINKPHGLNKGLKEAKNEIITIFDAEDEPHADIYKIVNTVLLKENADVIQSGVQLMNFDTHWFSALNVLEYFFWFKSGLHFFTKIGKVSPLGGNTVFFKKEWLEKINGWDETCLTEDADVGIRLTLAGAKIRVIYDEKHATQEETPPNIKSFIKQRTRWNQGFMQILQKRDWLKLPSLKQKLIAGYILFSPEIGALLFFYIPLAFGIAITKKLPILISLFSYLPFYLFLFQLLVNSIAINEFAKIYKLKASLWTSIKIILAFYPYQILLMTASFRAGYRLLAKQIGWEKTSHENAHRLQRKESNE